METSHMITVEKLIALLSEFDGNDYVVMSKDGEGNNFSPFAEAHTAAYVPESTWHGEIGLKELTEANRLAGYSEEDVKQGLNVVVLWPVN